MAPPFAMSELEVSAERTAELLREGTQVIDVREDYEWAVSYTHLTLPTKRIV